MKLSSKLLLIILSGVFFSVCFVGFFAFIYTKDSIQKTIQQEQLESVGQTLNKIDRFMEERYKNIEVVASDSIIKNILSDNATANTINTSIDLNQRVNELTIYTGPWETLSVVDSHAHTVFSTRITESNKSIPENSIAGGLYKKALLGKVVYSDALYDPVLKKTTVLFAAPIINQDKASKPVVGVAIGNLAWPAVIEILQGVNAPLVSLYNKQGKKIGDNISGFSKQYLVTPHQDQQDLQQSLKGEAGTQIIQDQKTHISSLASYASEKGYLNYNGNDWILLTEIPTSQVFASAESSAITITLTLMPIIIVINMIILLVVLRLLKPIEVLTSSVQQIATGDLSKRVEVHSKDEIGKLALAFNDMTAKLEESYQGMEQKVQEKTAELAEKVSEGERINKLMFDRESKMIELKKENIMLKEQLANISAKSSILQANQPGEGVKK